MTDTQALVDKLREKIEWDASKANLLHILAADHIEELRAENERLRNGNEKFAGGLRNVLIMIESWILEGVNPDHLPHLRRLIIKSLEENASKEPTDEH